jgi:hypothetical protein
MVTEGITEGVFAEAMQYAVAVQWLCSGCAVT